jgi:hypothetical protein
MVARAGPPDRREPFADQRWEVRVTIVGEERASGAGLRVAAAIALLALGAAALIASGPLHGGRGAKPTSPLVQRSNLRLERAADVYRYPLGCLGRTILAPQAAAGIARPDHASPCWRYGIYVTAILHRSWGVWRLALEAISASCPAVRLPLLVRAQLAVCRRPARPDRPPHELRAGVHPA